MRFLVDESTGPTVARWLNELGHNVYSVHQEAPGSTDEQIIKKAFNDERIIITNDKDFGEMVYRGGYKHVGIILLRLADERSSNKILVLGQFFENYLEQVENKFVVVTEDRVRFAK